MRHIPQLAACAAIIATTACSEPQSRGPEGQIEVRIGAKAIEDGGFANACFDIVVRTPGNSIGDGGSRSVYAQRGSEDETYPEDKETVCTNEIGAVLDNGRRAFSTVLPCIEGKTEVIVRLDSLWERNPDFKDAEGAPEFLRVQEFFDPCGPEGCSQPVDCVALQDRPAFFNIQYARPLQVGFTDVLVSVGDLACAAKFDCQYPGTDNEAPRPIRLLPKNGQLTDTGVMAVACTSIGDASSISMSFTNMTMSCSDTEIAEPTLAVQIAANKRQFVFGSQVWGTGEVRGFYAEVDAEGRAGIAKSLEASGNTFVASHYVDQYQANPAVLGYTTDVATGTTRSLAIAYFRQGATAPTFADLDLQGEPVAIRDGFVLVLQGNKSHVYDLARKKSAELSLVVSNGALTGCEDTARLYDGFMVAACELNTTVGIYAWIFDADAVTIDPTPLAVNLSGYQFSGNTKLGALPDGLYAVDKGNNKVFRWSGGNPIGGEVAGAWNAPEIVGNQIVNAGIAGNYLIYNSEDGGMYTATEGLNLTGVKLSDQNYICLDDAGGFKPCSLDQNSLVARTLVDTLTAPLATIDAVQDVELISSPGTPNPHNVYLVLGTNVDGEPISLYLDENKQDPVPTYAVIGYAEYPDATYNGFLKGERASFAIKNIWSIKSDIGVDLRLPDCKANGSACRTQIQPLYALATSSVTLPLDNDETIRGIGETADPYQCNWGQTLRGALGAPETYLACKFGIPSCASGTFTVTMCPSEESLTCDEGTETYGFPENWWPTCITWEIALTDLEGERACTTHPLAIGGTGVSLVSPGPGSPYPLTTQLAAPINANNLSDEGDGPEWITACEAAPEP